MGAKKVFLAVLCAGISLCVGSFSSFSSTGWAGETRSQTEADADTWMDYQLMIDAEVYTFPMMYEDFIAYGWSLESADEADTENEEEAEAEETLAPYRYGTYYFTKEDQTCAVFLLNLGINTVPITECIVAGILIDSLYWEGVDSVVTLPGGGIDSGSLDA
ncbi:MAG: hypothetical protein LUF30_13305 [Lachnospiraceae bacterium]|nr:hypothetical protein [Lachnospiraceae bacterium]